MSPEKLELVLAGLQSGQSEIKQRLTRVETVMEPMPEKLDALVVGFAKINGIPVANQERLNRLWKWIGIIGGIGILSGGVGTLIMEFVIRRLLIGG